MKCSLSINYRIQLASYVWKLVQKIVLRGSYLKRHDNLQGTLINSINVSFTGYIKVIKPAKINQMQQLFVHTLSTSIYKWSFFF